MPREKRQGVAAALPLVDPAAQPLPHEVGLRGNAEQQAAGNKFLRESGVYQIVIDQDVPPALVPFVPLINEFSKYLFINGLRDYTPEQRRDIVLQLERFILSDRADRRYFFQPRPKAAEPASSTATEIEAAPVLWPDKRLEKESPASYIQRHYEKWLGKGLTRADIRRLDRPLYDALAAWLARKGNDLPFDLPTKKAVNSRQLGKEIKVKAGPPEQQLREMERITSALRRHVRGGL